MKNSIFVIKPYRWNGMWVFDDPRVGLVQEPFVAGADAMIDAAVRLRRIADADEGFLMVFSAGPMPGVDFELDWVSEEAGGNVYQGRFEVDGEVRQMQGWLCPALGLYFSDVPMKLYVQVRPVK